LQVGLNIVRDLELDKTYGYSFEASKVAAE
jgi:hypothetical protein